MSETSFATVVASLHPRAGKTLLARVLADYFILSDEHPVVFDTEALEQGLSACFPDRSVVLDLDSVRDQMRLFDSLAQRSAGSRVVDVTHRSFRKFFDLMRDTDFVAEARANQVEPLIFFIADRNRDSFEAGRALIDRFTDCAVVVVDNAYLRQVASATRTSSGYQALEAHDLHLHIPVLDPIAASMLDDESLSLADVMRAPLRQSFTGVDTDDLELNARASIRAWLLKLFRGFHRVTQALEARLAPDEIPLLAAPQSSRSRV